MSDMKKAMNVKQELLQDGPPLELYNAKLAMHAIAR